MKLYGKNSVLERLRANPQSINKIYIEKGVGGVAPIIKKAKQSGIAVYSAAASKLQKIARNKNTQGVLADVCEFEYIEFDDLLYNAFKNKRCPVFLDGVNDPQNFGAIIRSLACLGKYSLVIPKHDSVSVTETVLRVASGGDSYVPVARVGNLCNCIKKAKDRGFWIMGAVVDGGKPINETKISFPIALVVGSEQKGIRDIVKKQLDILISIPMPVATLSFNVAHATTLVCYEITRQKKK